jgi:hypothetical protein
MKAFSTLQTAGQTGSAGLLKALAEYKKAVAAQEEEKADTQGRARCHAEMASIYTQLANPSVSPKEKDQTAYNASAKQELQLALQYTESSELRLTLAGIEVADAKVAKNPEEQYKAAVDDLSYVSANAYNDPKAHEQMLKLYETMLAGGYQKAASLVAEENKWKADYDKQMADQKAAAAAQQAAQSKPPSSGKPAQAAK